MDGLGGDLARPSSSDEADKHPEQCSKAYECGHYCEGSFSVRSPGVETELDQRASCNERE